MSSPFELQVDFKNECNWIYVLFVEFEICRHIRLHSKHSIYDKIKPSNLHKHSLFSKRYIINYVIVIEIYKWYFKNSFSLYSCINTGYMSDKTQEFCDLSLHSCNNGVSIASPRTWACGLGLLWTWMVHKIFACLAYWRGTISYNYCIYRSKVLQQEYCDSVMICHYHVWCK